MPKKSSKKPKKKEELPSFLQNLTSRNLDRKIEIKENPFRSEPVFFGECRKSQKTPHPISLGGLYYPQHLEVSDEDLNPELFLPEREPTEKVVAQRVKNRLEKKCTEELVDRYPHLCPGVRKAFVPVPEAFIPDFGETTSEIESDTWREIPFCRVKSSLFQSREPEIENVTLSDVKERKRALLPYEQRMAHNHFPKEFITVKLVGPVIPASITITKIPSKRKRMVDFAFEVKEKVDKSKSSKKTSPEATERTEVEEEGKEEEKEIKEVKLEDMETEVEEVEKEEPVEEKVEETEEAVKGEIEETEAPDEEKENATGKPDEGTEAPNEEKAEVTGEPDEGKEADEASENGAAVVREEEEQGAEVVDEGENVENDKEE